MKKNYLIVCRLLIFIIISSVLLFPITAQSQDLTEEQKTERCQNNRDRIAELDKQLKTTNDSLAQIPEKKEIEDARSYLSFVRKFKNPNNLSIDPRKKSDENFIKIKRVAVQYGFDFEKCISNNFRSGEEPYFVPKICYSELEKIVVKKIDKGVSLESRRSVLINKKNVIEKQLAIHRNNLIALDCDNQAKKPGGACKLKGRWTQYTPGIGSTDWVIESNGTAKEKGIGYAEGKATLSGNVLHIDWQTKTGYSGYYEWTLDDNCSSVKGTLVFKTGRSDTINNSTVKWSPF